jgi:hypothetical protein
MGEKLFALPKYLSFASYEEIIGKLIKFASTRELSDFGEFENALYAAKAERDSFGDEERMKNARLYSILNREAIPMDILTGRHLDDLEKIVIVVNAFKDSGMIDRGAFERCGEMMFEYCSNIERLLAENAGASAAWRSNAN